MRIRVFHLTLILFLLLICKPSLSIAALGQITGSAELRYGSQTATEGGARVLDAHHFTQQYSFLWSKSGKLKGGRLGHYDLALGYEWSWVDSEINHVKVNIENPLDKILYKGDLTLAPGGLPFKLHVFSYDLRNTRLTTTDLGQLFTRLGSNAPQDNFNCGIVTDIQNGTDVVSGVTLQAGVANGYYKGQYRDLLATVPRLLIDYRQHDVHDVKGPNPRDYVDHDLAFVSLNKRNNWFHYRVFEHDDNLDKSQNTREETFLLGTIDHEYQRKWINLTNWIKISADISHTIIAAGTGASSIRPAKRYDVNLFTSAQRTHWNVDNFTSFSRVRDEDSLDRTLEIPFYAHGELNRDTSWRFTAISNNYKTVDLLAHKDERSVFYANAQASIFRRARYLFKPRLAAEVKQGTEGEGTNIRLGGELYSNPSYRSPYDLYAGYNIALYSGTSRTGRTANFVENQLGGHIEKQVSDRVRAGFGQEVFFGSGQYDTSISEYISPVTTGIEAGHSAVVGFVDGDILRSATSSFVEIESGHGLKNRFSLLYDYVNSTSFDGGQLGFSHRLDYKPAVLKVVLENEGFIGSVLPTSISLGTANVSHVSLSTSEDARASYRGQLRVSYSPNRSYRSQLNASYNYISYKSASDYELINLRQLFEYAHWSLFGRLRKLFVLGQDAELGKGLRSSIQTQSYYTLSFYGTLYPTFRSYLGARLRYEHDDLNRYDIYSTYLTAGIKYSKLQVLVDYSHGLRPDSSSAPKRVEDKWEAKIKKTF